MKCDICGERESQVVALTNLDGEAFSFDACDDCVDQLHHLDNLEILPKAVS